jgi:TonB family protein
VATVAALLILTLSIAGFAAQSFFTFSGSLMDPTNHLLPRATLVLTSIGNEAKHEVKSDATGHFEFVGLPPGEYALEVRLPGFAIYKDTVAVSRNVDRTIELQVGSLEETLTVGGAGRSEPATDQQEQAQRARTRFEEMRRVNLETCSGSVNAVGGRIVVPIRLINIHPEYPESLRNAKMGGKVTLDAIIGTDGMMREVRAVSSPHQDLENAAIEAVRQWQYSQTLLNCVPIEVRMRVTTHFDSQQ